VSPLSIILSLKKLRDVADPLGHFPHRVGDRCRRSTCCHPPRRPGRHGSSPDSRSHRSYLATQPSTSLMTLTGIHRDTANLLLPRLYEESPPAKPCRAGAPHPIGSLGEDDVTPRPSSSCRTARHRTGQEHGDRRPRAHCAARHEPAGRCGRQAGPCHGLRWPVGPTRGATTTPGGSSLWASFGPAVGNPFSNFGLF
jgi:hypothetical protein